MIAKTIKVEYKCGDRFKILPISDIHYDGRGRNSLCDARKLSRFLAKEVDDKTIILGIGDWFGGILIKDIKRYRKDQDAASSEDILDESIEGLVEIFKPYKDQIYGIGDGNHEDTITVNCGTKLIPRLIEKLGGGILYLGYSWLLKLHFNRNGSSYRPLVIRGHHGWGGGSKTEGADITKYAHDVKFWQAQLFLYGHVHRIKVNPMEEGVMVGDSSWRTITKKMVVCGTYQRTYGNTTTATYAEKKGYSPASIDTPIVYAYPLSHGGVDLKVVV